MQNKTKQHASCIRDYLKAAEGAVLAFIPTSFHQDEVQLPRAQSLLISAALAAILLPLYAALYYYLGDCINSAFCLLATLPAIATLYVFRHTGALASASALLTASLFVLLIALSVRLGGIVAPTVAWFVVCPIIAVMTAGLRIGLMWTAAAMFAVAGLYVCPLLGVPFPALMVTDMHFLHLVATIGLVTVITVFILVFEKNNARGIARLSAALGQIQELAIKDELTGVYNRREIIRLARDEKRRQQRCGGTFCLCLIDIDHFKAVNDKYGHAVGDAVLNNIASGIQDHIRSTDRFGRYGGEEFLLVLADTNADEAEILVDRIRRLVGGLASPGTAKLKITISAGIAQHREGEKTADTITRADAALYQAKHAGRNRVMAA